LTDKTFTISETDLEPGGTWILYLRNSVILQWYSVVLQWYSVALQWYSVALQWYSVALQQYNIVLQWYSVVLQWYSVILQWYSVVLQWYSVVLQYYSVVVQRYSVGGDRHLPRLAGQPDHECPGRQRTWLNWRKLTVSGIIASLAEDLTEQTKPFRGKKGEYHGSH